MPPHVGRLAYFNEEQRAATRETPDAVAEAEAVERFAEDLQVLAEEAGEREGSGSAPALWLGRPPRRSESGSDWS